MMTTSVAGAQVRVRCPITNPTTHSLNCYWEQLMQTCSVGGCEKPIHGGGLCDMHRMRLRRNGSLEPTRRPVGAGGIGKSGHVLICSSGVRKYQHIIIAEEVLGKPLPVGAQVHHVDLNPSNNRNDNLVICPSDAYHKLLHQRLRALVKCGNPNWRSCHFCGEYDDPLNLAFRKTGSAFHRNCERDYDKKRYLRRVAK
jgi:hypothetical protein